MAHTSRARRAPAAKPRLTTRAKFRHLTGRDPGQVGEIRVAPQQLKALDAGGVPHYWHPEREGVEPCPADFAAKLAAIHPDLRMVRPPTRAPLPTQFQCWTLWTRKREITHRLCPGWQLLLPWSFYGKALPLDERVFAAIAHFDSRKLGENAVQYFDRLIRERDRDREKADVSHRADVVSDATDFAQFTKIKNIGRGNKFALHHDGTVLPGRGERAWTRENERRMLPKRMLDDRERRRS